MVLAVLLVVYFTYNKNDDPKDSVDMNTSLEENIDVASIDTDKVISVHYIAKDADITLTLENDIWISENDPIRPINQSYVTNMINLVEKVNARRLVSEDVDDLSEYGLDNPSAYLKLTMEDGTGLSLKVGDKSTGINGNYGMVNEDNKVYLLNPTYGAGLEYSDIDFTAVESKPEISAETIEHIQVINRDGDDFELIKDDDNKHNYLNSNISNWVITKPYDGAYAADTSKISEVQGKYTDFSFQSCVDYSGENFGQHGLDDPEASIYIKYDNNEYKLYVGDKADENNYYVMREGSDYVYTMRASLVDVMLNREAFEVLNPLILIPNIDSVDSIDIEIDGTAYYISNKELEGEDFKKVYQNMISARYDAEIKDEINIDNISPYLTIKYNIIGDGNSSYQVSFLPYDDSFYLVDTGNKISFFADKRQIDSIIQSIKDI